MKAVNCKKNDIIRLSYAGPAFRVNQCIYFNQEIVILDLTKCSTNRQVDITCPPDKRVYFVPPVIC